MNHEELESLLRSVAETDRVPTPSSGNLSENVRKTYQRRQVRKHRLRYALAMASCYVAGILTVWGLMSAGLDPNKPVDPRERGTRVVHVPPTAPRHQETRPSEIPRTKPTSPQPIVEQSPYESFRQLGEESLQRNDIQTAVTHYNKALSAATQAELKISYEKDDWLLISLKKDRLVSQVTQTQGESI